jgi:hypothetical protein
METVVHFDNIPQEIAKRLTAAEEQIVAAVAHFTDHDLFDILCRQAGRGVTVRLAIPDDPNNFGPGGLNFQRLRDIGGEVVALPASCDTNPAMGHNFCVIDQDTVIAGSHNWTEQAQGDSDGIVITAASEGQGDGADDIGLGIAADYLDAFEGLLREHGLGPRLLDVAEVRRRLEIVGHLLALEDWDTLAGQLDKLRPARLAMGLDPLFAALQGPGDGAAAAWIDEYLSGGTDLSVVRRHQTALLRLTLRALDLQITALLAEKAEIDRQVHAFSLRAAHALGDLTSRYLELKAEKLRRQATVDPSLEAEAGCAQTEYEAYRDASAHARETPLPAPLDVEELTELKRLYRLTSQRCHPDKVHPDDQERAGQLFIQLQTAYRNNDIAAVRAIHAKVRDGNLFVEHGIALTEPETLRHGILVLRNDLDQLMVELQELRRTETYRTMKGLTDWDAYFDEQSLVLQDSILLLEDELARMDGLVTDSDSQDDSEHVRIRAFPEDHPDILVHVLSAHTAAGHDLLMRFSERWDWGGAIQQPSAGAESRPDRTVHQSVGLAGPIPESVSALERAID